MRTIIKDNVMYGLNAVTKTLNGNKRASVEFIIVENLEKELSKEVKCYKKTMKRGVVIAVSSLLVFLGGLAGFVLIEPSLWKLLFFFIVFVGWILPLICMFMVIENYILLKKVKEDNSRILDFNNDEMITNEGIIKGDLFSQAGLKGVANDVYLGLDRETIEKYFNSVDEDELIDLIKLTVECKELLKVKDDLHKSLTVLDKDNAFFEDLTNRLKTVTLLLRKTEEIYDSNSVLEKILQFSIINQHSENEAQALRLLSETSKFAA